MTQYGFHFNGARCTGCKTCAMACKDKNDLPPELGFRNVYEYTGGSWNQDGDLWTNDVYSYYMSVACNHCDSPACVEICPQSALSKDEETGAVVRDLEACIGCGSCASACPYGAPKVDTEAMKSVKCDMCVDRVKAGEKPVCVEACPLRALDFGPIEELRATYGEEAAIAPLPDPSVTMPNLVITPSPKAKPADDTSGMVANPRELS